MLAPFAKFLHPSSKSWDDHFLVKIHQNPSDVRPKKPEKRDIRDQQNSQIKEPQPIQPSSAQHHGCIASDRKKDPSVETGQSHGFDVTGARVKIHRGVPKELSPRNYDWTMYCRNCRNAFAQLNQQKHTKTTLRMPSELAFWRNFHKHTIHPYTHTHIYIYTHASISKQTSNHCASTVDFESIGKFAFIYMCIYISIYIHIYIYFHI